MKNFTDMKKLKEFSTLKLTSQEMLNVVLYQKRKDQNQKYENYDRKHFIGKGKYRVKVVNEPPKKLVGRIKIKSSKIIYIPLIVE